MAAVFTTDALAAAPENVAPTEADIANVTAHLLDHAHFSHRPFDERLSSQFMDCYLDALDGSHLLCLQSDVDEFGWFRPKLAQMAVSEGDTWPAHLIYARFRERLAQQVNFETNILQSAKFDKS
jgi:carboxyl-terminal processing protease